MKENKIIPQVAQAISHLDEYQQLKLLEFINALMGANHPQKNGLLKYTGSIEPAELQLMEHAIKDCDKIDRDEW